MVDTSSGVLGSVAVEVKADLSRLTADFARGRAQTQAFAQDLQRGVGPTNQLTLAQQELSTQLAGVRRQFDPLGTARAKYATELTIVQQAEKGGLVTQAESIALQRSMGAAFIDTTKKIEGESIGLAGMARHMEHHVRAMRLLISFIGLDLVKSLVEFSMKTLEATASLKYEAEALGLTTEQLQEYRALAPQVGMSSKDMDSAFGSLGKTLDDIALGAAPQTMKVIDALGVEIYDATGKMKSRDVIFKELIERLGQVGDEAERRGAQVLLFGEAGSKMGDLVKQGSSGIDKLKQAVKDTGGVLSDEQIQNADKTAKKLDQLWSVLKVKIASTVVENADSIYTLADAFSHLAANAVQNASGQIRDFIERMRELKGAVNEFFTDMAATGNQPLAALVYGVGNDLQDMQDKRNHNAPSTGLNEVGTSNTIKLSDARQIPSPAQKPKGPNISLAGLLNPDPKKGPTAKQPKFDTFETDMAQELQRQLQIEHDATTNIIEQNRLEKEIIEKKLIERDRSIDKQVKSGELTKAEGAQLKAAASTTATMEKEAADHHMRLADLDRANQFADELARLDDDALNTARDLARTDSQRKTIDRLILESKQQQAKSELQKEINIATENKDWERVHELNAEMIRLQSNQLAEWKKFDNDHLNAMQRFQKDLPKTSEEFNDQIKSMAFQQFNEKLQQSAQFANDVGDAFGSLASDLAQFKNPLTALQNFISNLAATFTKNFIEKPVSDWARDHLGAPLAKQAFGKDLDKLSKEAGGTALTTAQMNTALAQATQSLYLLTTAAQSAASAISAQGVAGAAGGGGFSGSSIASLFGGGGSSSLGSLFDASGGFGSLFSGGGEAFSGSMLSGLGDSFALGSVPFSFGFADGGYTGSGADGDVKGVVHANEFVVHSGAVAALGLPFLSSLNAGSANPFTSRGTPGGSIAPATAPAGPAGAAGMDGAAAMLMDAAQALLQAAQALGGAGGGKKGGAGGILTSLLGIGAGMLLGGKGGGAGGLLGGLLGGGGKSALTGGLSPLSLGGMLLGGGPFGSASPGGLAAGGDLFSFGFDTGGFTGSGSDHEPAGIVHKNEYVWDADTTRAWMPVIKMIHTGKMPSVPGPGLAQLGASRSTGDRPMHVNFGDIHLHGVGDERAARQSANQFMSHVQQRTASVIKKGLNQ